VPGTQVDPPTRVAPASLLMRYPGVKAVAVLAAVLALSGCASYVWSRPGATPEVLARDQAQCQDEARYVAQDYDRPGFHYGDPGWRQPLPPAPSGLEIEQAHFGRCMESRGYRLEKETSQRR
jgi:hypothetical protein